MLTEERIAKPRLTNMPDVPLRDEKLGDASAPDAITS
jgi:hypothetical protein